MAELTGRQRRHLRALGAHLPAVVTVGRNGIGEAVLRSVEEAYHTGDLVKVRLGRACAQVRQEAAAQLAQATGSHLVQVLGRTVLLYRCDPKAPRVQLPD